MKHTAYIIGVILFVGIFLNISRAASPERAHMKLLEKRDALDTEIIRVLEEEMNPIQDKLDEMEFEYIALTDELIDMQEELQEECMYWDSPTRTFYEELGCREVKG